MITMVLTSIATVALVTGHDGLAIVCGVAIAVDLFLFQET